MQIESIEAIDKKRQSVVFDNGERVVLYIGEIRKLNLSTDREVSDDIYGRIMHELLPRRAKLRGLNLLKSRPYTEQQLRKKYIDGGYPESIVDEAIEYLKGYHYIDDYEYCNNYIIYKSSSRSRRRIVNDLMQKGISRELINEAYDGLHEAGDIEDESELVSKLLEKKKYNRDDASYEDRQKMMAFLYNKGFSMDTIMSSLG